MAPGSGTEGTRRNDALIDGGGRLLDRAGLKEKIGDYNTGDRGSLEFRSIPRSLVILLDSLKVGKTTHVKCSDGSLQLVRKKDGSVSAP